MRSSGGRTLHTERPIFLYTLMPATRTSYTWLLVGVVLSGHTPCMEALADSIRSVNCECSCLASWVWPYCSSISNSDGTSSDQEINVCHKLGSQCSHYKQLLTLETVDCATQVRDSLYQCKVLVTTTFSETPFLVAGLTTSFHRLTASEKDHPL